LINAGDEAGLIEILKGLRGHLRQTCVVRAFLDNPVEFEKHWGEGVPIELVFGLTEPMEYYLACDHNTVSRSRVSVIMQVFEMFKRGCSETDVVLQTWDELGIHFTAVTADQMARIKAHKTAAGQAKEMKAIRRGVVQPLHYIATNLPSYVEEAVLNHERGEEGPKLKYSVAGALNTANLEGSQQTPTASFTDLYATKLKEYGQKSKGTSVRSQKEMKEFFGRWTSDTMELFRMWMFKEVDINFMELDSQLCDNEAAGNIKMPAFAQAQAVRNARKDKAANN
jgi:hypothetical protein